VILVASASTNDLHDTLEAGVIDAAGHVLASTKEEHDSAEMGVADEAGHVLASTYDLHESADAGVMEEGTAAATTDEVGDGVGVTDLLPNTRLMTTTTIINKTNPPPI
jgi:hypothetical protein